MHWIWGPVVGKAIASDGSILITADSSALAALFPNGTFQWLVGGYPNYPLGPQRYDTSQYYSTYGPPIIGDGTVFVPRGDILQALNAYEVTTVSDSPPPTPASSAGQPLATMTQVAVTCAFLVLLIQ
jgi:outer membrane protein assembly factor BamB